MSLTYVLHSIKAKAKAKAKSHIVRYITDTFYIPIELNPRYCEINGTYDFYYEKKEKRNVHRLQAHISGNPENGLHFLTIRLLSDFFLSNLYASTHFFSSFSPYRIQWNGPFLSWTAQEKKNHDLRLSTDQINAIIWNTSEIVKMPFGTMRRRRLW